MVWNLIERYETILYWSLLVLVVFAPSILRRTRRTLRRAIRPRYTIHDLSLPLKGEWFVFWGGDRPSQNHHYDSEVQRYAFDFVMAPSGEADETYQNDGARNEDYFCFGRPILAPRDGRVVCVVDGIEDNAPGEMNEQMVYGNTVMIEHVSGLISVLAHLKKHSLRVKEGDTVNAGTVVGECGNSGNSSEAHLHYHVQTEPGFEHGAAVKVFFRELMEKQKGELHDYSPVKGDIIYPVMQSPARQPLKDDIL